MDQGLAVIILWVVGLLGVTVTAWATITAARINARSGRSPLNELFALVTLIAPIAAAVFIILHYEHIANVLIAIFFISLIGFFVNVVAEKR